MRTDVVIHTHRCDIDHIVIHRLDINHRRSISVCDTHRKRLASNVTERRCRTTYSDGAEDFFAVVLFTITEYIEFVVVKHHRVVHRSSGRGRVEQCYYSALVQSS